MVVDLKQYKSHPHKELLVHIKGVLDRTKSLTNSKIAELAAIFHDFGKMNPNFQSKFTDKPNEGYANHGYLSAYAFFCFLFKNQDYIQKVLGEDAQNKVLSIIAIIAKHHGNIPNFNSLLNADECIELYKFLDSYNQFPATEFTREFIPETNNFSLLTNENIQYKFREKLGVASSNNYLDIFLETQFAFASLIQADKSDAGDINLEKEKGEINIFCSEYSDKLSLYLNTLKPNSELNIIRTQIRTEAIQKLALLLKTTNKRVFSLTAPTGAGKTLMLLSLANNIIKEKGNFRIIYSIPFLSITEQVEKECLKIFGNKFIQRIDSKSSNSDFDKIQKELETNPEKIKEMMKAKFSEDIFIAPFIITTFVRFFETLVCNINATLLKLSNFANCIFLIDEIQSLPPRLYSFFVAYLSAFCEKNNSYCIVSTATMPDFSLPTNSDIKRNPKILFKNFVEPEELLSFDYFNHTVFNRYEIIQNKITIECTELSDTIFKENQSVLIIVNTIDDSKEIYNLLSENLSKNELILLNTHFTPNDRKKKIEYAKSRLANKEKIVLISTQLIEAGVDIDFPVLYRDMATIPSIIQSAGRCNRNGKLENLGKVVVFNLAKSGKLRAELIYRGKDSNLLKNTKKALIENIYSEKSLFTVQKKFFKILGEELVFGEHSQKKPEVNINFVQDINDLAFDTIGKFRLIDEDFYGEEFRCYVPIDKNDNSFGELQSLDTKFKETLDFTKKEKDFNKIMSAKFAIEEHLKRMSNQIVQIRLKKTDTQPVSHGNYNELHLIDFGSYSFETGIKLNVENQLI